MTLHSGLVVLERLRGTARRLILGWVATWVRKKWSLVARRGNRACCRFALLGTKPAMVRYLALYSAFVQGV